MRSLYIMIPLIVGSLLLQGCSKDQDLDDYKKTRLDANMAQLQAVAGRYSGYLKSKNSNTNLGALQMTLKATTQTINSSDESKASAQPILVVNLEFQGATHMTISAPNSTYDSGSGAFTATITVPHKDAQGKDLPAVQVGITGVIGGGTITGTLEASNFDSNYGSTFVLSTGGGSLDSLAKQSSFDSNILFSQKNYTGTTAFKDGTTKSVKMVVSKPKTTSEDDFLTLLVPVKPVLVTLNYGDGALIPFVNGNLDQTTGKLTGQYVLAVTSPVPGSTASQTVNLSLDCTLTADSLAMTCPVTTDSSGTVATVNLTANTTGKDTPDPDDSSSTRDSVTRNYTGTAQLAPGEEWIPVTMTAVYQARDRMEEIIDLLVPQAEEVLQISLLFPPISINFTTVKFDASKGTLDGQKTLTEDTDSATLSLACKNFFFTDKVTKPFTCTYLSSFTNTNVLFKFDAQN